MAQRFLVVWVTFDQPARLHGFKARREHLRCHFGLDLYFFEASGTHKQFTQDQQGPFAA